MNIYLMKKPKRINAVSVTLFLMVAAAGYLGWALIPTWWPVFQLTGIMRGVCNDAYREPNNEKLLKKLVKEGRRTKLRLSEENFQITREPFTTDELLKVPDQFARTTMVTRGKACIITFHYEDEYMWPLIERPRHVVYDREVYTLLEQVSWKKEDQLCTCVTIPPSR